jgi:hypothetical protein
VAHRQQRVRNLHLSRDADDARAGDVVEAKRSSLNLAAARSLLARALAHALTTALTVSHGLTERALSIEGTNALNAFTTLTP